MLAARIADHLRVRNLAAGAHLSAQSLAKAFGASRTPVSKALAILGRDGTLRHEPHRGYFVIAPLGVFGDPPELVVLEERYRDIARDRLAGGLPDQVTETLLRERYRLGRHQLHLLLTRIAHEGWIEHRVGYGWAFAEMLTTPEALADTFRVRRVLEPAALLEPGYRLDPQVIRDCRKAELAMLAGEMDSLSLEALFSRRANFHEALVAGSGNRFFLDSIRRLNRIRRLLSYRTSEDRRRYTLHCHEHLALLDLLEAGRNEAAAEALREPLDGAAERIRARSWRPAGPRLSGSAQRGPGRPGPASCLLLR
ncbi:MAG: GntR family transcriptional regulator [Roseomonas sp.]|nr:GntR family transcriptional regulator [Roseomonas sp.]